MGKACGHLYITSPTGKQGKVMYEGFLNNKDTEIAYMVIKDPSGLAHKDQFYSKMGGLFIDALHEVK